MGEDTMNGWVLDKSCVTIIDATEQCSECSVNKATHVVMLDLGSQTVALGAESGPTHCLECAEQQAAEIRNMLPDVNYRQPNEPDDYDGPP